MSPADYGRLTVLLIFGMFVYAVVRPLARGFWRGFNGETQRAKDADKNTIVDLATQEYDGLSPELLDALLRMPAGSPMSDLDVRVALANPLLFAPPGEGVRSLRPLGATSTLPAAESNDSPPRRGLERLNGSPTMKPSTPKDLRDIVQWIENDPNFSFSLAPDVGPLLALADAMEKPYSGAPTGDVIARFVAILGDSLQRDHGHGLTTVISPLEARSLHAAIIEEGMQTAESLTKAGLAAVRAEDRATEMAGLVDEQARLIDSLRRTVRRLSDMLKSADDDKVEVKFVFVPTPASLEDPSAMGVEEAMDLALAIDSAK